MCFVSWWGRNDFGFDLYPVCMFLFLSFSLMKMEFLKILFEGFTCKRKNVFTPFAVEFILSFSIFLKDLFGGRKMNDGSNPCLFYHDKYLYVSTRVWTWIQSIYYCCDQPTIFFCLFILLSMVMGSTHIGYNGYMPSIGMSLSSSMFNIALFYGLQWYYSNLCSYLLGLWYGLKPWFISIYFKKRMRI